MSVFTVALQTLILLRQLELASVKNVLPTLFPCLAISGVHAILVGQILLVKISPKKVTTSIHSIVLIALLILCLRVALVKPARLAPTDRLFAITFVPVLLG